jgi:YD repeat-containing protein
VYKTRLRLANWLWIDFSLLALLLLTISLGSANAQGARQSYQYDSLGRLVGAQDSLGIQANTQYDASSNQEVYSVTSGTPPAPPNLTGIVPSMLTNYIITNGTMVFAAPAENRR